MQLAAAEADAVKIYCANSLSIDGVGEGGEKRHLAINKRRHVDVEEVTKAFSLSSHAALIKRTTKINFKLLKSLVNYGAVISPAYQSANYNSGWSKTKAKIDETFHRDFAICLT